MNRIKIRKTTVGVGIALFVVVMSLGLIRSSGRKRIPATKAGVNIRLSKMPRIILWAWERPEHLEFIDPKTTGVAFLAQTIYLRADKAVARPRLQPLNVPDRTTLIAVTRIEVDRTDAPSLSAEQIHLAAAEVTAIAKLPRVVTVQIDFDATQSQRAFYRELLLTVRHELPDSTGLSITALASWCKADDWLSDLPLDEAVPMLFRMGVERRQILAQLQAGEQFTSTPCGSSAGISIDEPLSFLPTTQRLYVFNPRPWSSTDVNNVKETYQR